MFFKVELPRADIWKLFGSSSAEFEENYLIFLVNPNNSETNRSWEPQLHSWVYITVSNLYKKKEGQPEVTARY